MNFKFIKSDLILNIKHWLRSTGTVFWTLLFPVLLILIFGAIFSGGTDVEFDLVIQDLDDTFFSEKFVSNLNNITGVKLIPLDKDKDLSDYMLDEDKKVGLIIPEGFEFFINEYMQSKSDPNVTLNEDELPFNLTLIVDPSDQTTTSILRNIIYSVIQQLNINITGGQNILGISEESSMGEDFEYIDFFVPGVIGFTIMTSMVYGSIERNTKYRKDGILRKLSTTPVKRAEWIFSKMLFMLFLSFISTFVIILVGMLVWGLSVEINIFFFILVISTSFMFTGLGMIIGRFVKEEETADMAGGAITFPMMFLAGTFFPLEQMPEFLQTLAQALPLYYVNEGFRSAMVNVNFGDALYFSGIVVLFALIFFIAGVFVTKWEED